MTSGTDQDELRRINAHLGARIRTRRRSLGMSLEELGRALGIAYQQVQKYETGENRLSADRLPVLSHVLQVPIGYFFATSPQPGCMGPGQAPDAWIAELVEAWGRIADPGMRGHVLALARGLGRPEARPDPLVRG